MLINVHMGPDETQGGRFDTLISPSGSVATLLKIEEDLGLMDIIGIDESFPGEIESKQKIAEIITHDSSENKVTTLFFSTLIYNAKRTIDYVKELKREHGNRVRIIIGGQLVPFAEKAYMENTDIDSACIGDAEVILPKLIQDIERNAVQKRYEGWVKDERKQEFAGMSYRRFWKIQERLEQQRLETPRFDRQGRLVEKGFAQVTTQGAGGPGCSWAANNVNGACFFCALQNITTMNKTSLRKILENEAEIAKELGVDRFFDVANLFLPFLDRGKNKEWLREYIRIRGELSMAAQKYVYLTVGSVDKEIAQLLKEAGVCEAYIGIDHFDKQALTEENKPGRSEAILKNTLDALQGEGIGFRAGIVLGSARESEQTLDTVREGVRMLLERYPDSLRVLAVFPVEIIPGSKVFEDMKSRGMSPEIFESFEKTGYMSREEQRALTKEYIRQNSEVSPERIFELEKEISRVMSREGKFEYMVDKKENSELDRFKRSFGESFK